MTLAVDSGPGHAGVMLGEFASGRIDPERFAMISAGAGPLDTVGRSIAEHMAALGAKVVISSRKAEACNEVAAAIKAAGGEAIVIPCNISRKAEVEALIKGVPAAEAKVSPAKPAAAQPAPTDARVVNREEMVLIIDGGRHEVCVEKLGA